MKTHRPNSATWRKLHCIGRKEKCFFLADIQAASQESQQMMLLFIGAKLSQKALSYGNSSLPRILNKSDINVQHDPQSMHAVPHFPYCPPFVSFTAFLLRFHTSNGQNSAVTR
jgi:hypothetical protein